MLTIVDYGAGNLRSVYMAFRRLGIEARVSDDPRDLSAAEAIVLPGVGAFGDNIGRIRARGLEAPLLAAIRADVPFLGICLGLQMLFEVSDEMGEYRGLGVLAGRVRRFPTGLHVPQMGWNQVKQARPSALWRDLPDDSYVYLVHSYYVEPQDPTVVIGTTDYGLTYASAVGRGNLWGIQFHPEKSQDVGARILHNFSLAAGLVR
ncbi:MAG: imidazole glycerol phosphate synthase subunit HisH [Chloroflexi bacterium]|nr:imidazole glycerol phosphate synthase subunit HisH [Chloroflexota bacterium]